MRCEKHSSVHTKLSRIWRCCLYVCTGVTILAHSGTYFLKMCGSQNLQSSLSAL